MYYVRVSSRVVVPAIWSSLKDNRLFCFSFFFFFGHCVRQHMHAAYLHTHLHTLCRFMQYRLIDTVSAAYPAQGPANYLLCLWSVDTLLLQRKASTAAVVRAMTFTNCIFTRGDSHTHTQTHTNWSCCCYSKGLNALLPFFRRLRFDLLLLPPAYRCKLFSICMHVVNRQSFVFIFFSYFFFTFFGLQPHTN